MTPAPDFRTTRSGFLARVRGALGQSGPTSAPAPFPSDNDLIRIAHPGDKIIDRFATKAAAAGMTVHRCAADICADAVVSILNKAGANRIIAHEDALPPSVREQLIRAGVAFLPSADGMDAAFDADTGLTGVVAAVAETGSIVVASGPGRARAAFIAPEVHIALVRESQVVPDLVDLWSSRNRAAPNSSAPNPTPPIPTALTVISGPSKTSDIEGILITRVHGPGEVHVILLTGV